MWCWQWEQELNVCILTPDTDSVHLILDDQQDVYCGKKTHLFIIMSEELYWGRVLPMPLLSRRSGQQRSNNAKKPKKRNLFTDEYKLALWGQFVFYVPWRWRLPNQPLNYSEQHFTPTFHHLTNSLDKHLPRTLSIYKCCSFVVVQSSVLVFVYHQDKQFKKKNSRVKTWQSVAMVSTEDHPWRIRQCCVIKRRNCPAADPNCVRRWI